MFIQGAPARAQKYRSSSSSSSSSLNKKSRFGQQTHTHARMHPRTHHRHTYLPTYIIIIITSSAPTKPVRFAVSTPRPTVILLYLLLCTSLDRSTGGMDPCLSSIHQSMFNTTSRRRWVPATTRGHRRRRRQSPYITMPSHGGHFSHTTIVRLSKMNGLGPPKDRVLRTTRSMYNSLSQRTMHSV